MKKICLDLDGVLAQYDGWRGADAIGEPLDGAKQFVQTLIDDGYQVVVHSARAPVRVDKWLHDHNFPQDVVVSPRKPPATAYIDDNGIRFNGDFVEVYNQLKTLTPWWRK